MPKPPLSRLSDLDKVQRLLDTFTHPDKDQWISPIAAWERREADCLEGAVFACMALKANGKKAFLVDLRGVRDDDHVVCVVKTPTGYGAVAHSRYLGLRGRAPVYSSIRELVMSYFESYFNHRGELTLREYSVPFDPDKWYTDWKENPKTMRRLEKDLDSIKHYRIFRGGRLPRVSKDRFWRELVVPPKKMRIGKEYA